MTLRFLILCAVLCVYAASAEASAAPLTCGTCREARLNENFPKYLCYDIDNRYSTLRQRMYVLSSTNQFEAISRVLVKAYKEVHKCQTDVCAYTLLFQEKLPFVFANVTNKEEMEILCLSYHNAFCKHYFNSDKRDASSDVKEIIAFVSGHPPECLQSMIDYHIPEVLANMQFTPPPTYTTKPTEHTTDNGHSTLGSSSATPRTPTSTAKATDAVTSNTPTAKATDAVTSNTPTAKATVTVTSNTPTAKATVTLTSNTPTAKATDTVTSNTPTAKATDAVTSNTPTAKATDAVTSNTPTAAKTTPTPQSLTCATCTDLVSCTFAPTEITCGPGDLCMTTVIDSLAGSRNVMKGCKSVNWCGSNWWSQTSDVSTCLDVDTNLHNFDQKCMYCCEKDKCNAGSTLVPTNLYRPKH
ncbi:chitinase-like protein PB1E7.04c [Haliotis rufescens]|uniref:chitinase-like protein PB1E7.04c n=1 Tax=Haliotis rufescens TaxID=6454 RepID=UPI00201F2756|nr:chitinase-like protein PB1E7.04c [Haliotis rufescens]